MKRILLCSALALFAGCAGNETDTGFDGTGVAQENLGVGTGKNRCPDPTTDCTQLNGPGVYTDEGGYAGMGDVMFMITHFITTTQNQVKFDGIQFNAATNAYEPAPNLGLVTGATYLGVSYNVVAVTESKTVPTWTLANPVTGGEINVTAGGLLNLTLSIAVNDGLADDKALGLRFTGGGIDSTGKLAVEYFNMVWTRGNKSFQYCLHNDETWSNDQVVFQGSIAVDPNTATVTRDSTTTNMVTLSCRGGAMATVHKWGYGYRTGYNPKFFDAALQMKRASYCADAHFYTVAGTAIKITDSIDVNDDPISLVEAFWSPQGALCVDLGNMRHPELGFTGSCNGKQLPSCDGYPQPGYAYIEDGAAKLNP